MDINSQIIHYYNNGWRLKDIGAKVGLTEKQVKSRLQKLRQKHEVKRWWRA